jgi:hypothetical protein
MITLYLLAVSVGLLVLGASLAWPVAYRRGQQRAAEREAAEIRDVYARIRAVRAAAAHRRPSLRARVRLWLALARQELADVRS